jgi:hypothetical protein
MIRHLPFHYLHVETFQQETVHPQLQYLQNSAKENMMCQLKNCSITKIVSNCCDALHLFIMYTNTRIRSNNIIYIIRLKEKLEGLICCGQII